MLDLAAAAAIAVLVGLGIGSGGLFIIYLTMVAGMEQLAAQGLNLLFFLAASAGALAVHLRRRRLRPAAVLLLGATGAAGAVGGSLLAPLLGSSLLRTLFGILMIISGALVLLRK